MKVDVIVENVEQIGGILDIEEEDRTAVIKKTIIINVIIGVAESILDDGEGRLDVI